MLAGTSSWREAPSAVGMHVEVVGWVGSAGQGMPKLLDHQIMMP